MQLLNFSTQIINLHVLYPTKILGQEEVDVQEFSEIIDSISWTRMYHSLMYKNSMKHFYFPDLSCYDYALNPMFIYPFKIFSAHG